MTTFDKSRYQGAQQYPRSSSDIWRKVNLQPWFRSRATNAPVFDSDRCGFVRYGKEQLEDTSMYSGEGRMCEIL